MADSISEEIRAEKITRDQGIKILEEYDGSYSSEFIEFCSYIDIEVDLFWEIVKKSVNRNLFNIEKMVQLNHFLK